jgi:hypothetical protein
MGGRSLALASPVTATAYRARRLSVNRSCEPERTPPFVASVADTDSASPAAIRGAKNIREHVVCSSQLDTLNLYVQDGQGTPSPGVINFVKRVRDVGYAGELFRHVCLLS